MNDKLITDNIPLIYLAIKKLHIYWETEDEFQYHYDNGLIGLIKGAKTFDSRKGFKESTYLYTCIAKEINNGIYVNQTKKRKNIYGKDISLDYLLNENSEDTFLDIIPDPNINIEEEVENKLEYENILSAIDNLENEEDKETIKYYYGLIDGKNYTLRQIAKIKNISPQMVSIRLNRAIKNVRVAVLYHNCSYVKKEKINKKEGIIVSRNLAALNDCLFEELERLKEDELLKNEEQFNKELKRSNAITQVACQIVQNAKVVLEARRDEKTFNKKLDNFYKLDYKNE